MQKFSSNVIERALRYCSTRKEKRGSTPWVDVIVRELLSQIGVLIRDRYGNYCLQTALVSAKHGSPDLLQEFIFQAEHHLADLRENVRAKWNQLLAKASEDHRNIQKTAGGWL